MDYRNFFMELLQKLVSIPSVSQEERICAEFLADFLKEELGMETELQQVEGNSYNVYGYLKGRRDGSQADRPAAYEGSVRGQNREDGCGGRAGRAQRSIQEEKTRQAGRRLLLGGHIDTVSPGEGWLTDPFSLTVEGDQAFGRGAMDMKGGLAAQIAVLKRLTDEGADFEGVVELVGFCDEERHSIGANAYVEKIRRDACKAPDFCIFGEPHFENIVVGATGKVLLELTVQGSAGHAANPESGVNAIDCMAEFLKAVNDTWGTRYREGRAASHCALKIESAYQGYSLSIPVECKALMNKQLYVSERVEAIISELQELYESRVGKGKLEIRRQIPYYPSYELDQNNGDFQALLELLEKDYAHAPELRLNQSVSDGNILVQELGTPTILFGPDGGCLHKANEYILLSSAYTYMDMLYDFIRRYFN